MCSVIYVCGIRDVSSCICVHGRRCVQLFLCTGCNIYVQLNLCVCVCGVSNCICARLTSNYMTVRCGLNRIRVLDLSSCISLPDMCPIPLVYGTRNLSNFMWMQDNRCACRHLFLVRPYCLGNALSDIIFAWLILK